MIRGLIYLLALTLSACVDNSKVSLLETQFADLQKRIASLENEVEATKQQTSLNNAIKRFESVAYLTPGSDGYSVVKSDLGVLTISLKNVQPYANGSKVTLNFGNVVYANINGLKAKVEWGAVGKDGLPDNENARSREVTFSESLRPGTWTSVSVVLEAVPPNELGFVRVRDVTHTGINLLAR